MFLLYGFLKNHLLSRVGSHTAVGVSKSVQPFLHSRACFYSKTWRSGAAIRIGSQVRHFPETGDNINLGSITIW